MGQKWAHWPCRIKINDFPIFMGDIVSLLVSMKRIDKFLELKEVQPGIIERGSDSE